MNLFFVEEVYDEIFDGLEPKNVTTDVPNTVVTVNKNDLIQRLATLENENTELKIQLRSGICVAYFLSNFLSLIRTKKLSNLTELLFLNYKMDQNTSQNDK